MAMYGATAGQIAVLRVKAATNQAVCGVIVGDSLVTAFLEAVLRAMVPSLLVKRVGGAQPNLSQGLIRAIELPVPPIAVQRPFADRLAAVEHAFEAASAHYEDLHSLFASLQDRAFSGAL